MKHSDQSHSRLFGALAERPRPAKELRQMLGAISPATLSRMVRRVDGRIAILGQARASTYALPRDQRGNGWRFPVYQLDEFGDAQLRGELWTLQGGCWWQGDADWPSRLYPGLPWFLADLKPDGFIGQAIIRRHGPELGLPDRLRDLNDDDILLALSKRGEDLAGDLLIGDESLQRYLASARGPAATAHVSDYPVLAEAALSNNLSGPMLGGEQPKFTTSITQAGLIRQVLVKFSPLITTPVGQRWSDLLVCEHVALGVVREMGIPAAASRIHQISGRTFLEVRRFDRTDRLGRSGQHSLAAVNDAFIGDRRNWSATAKMLLSKKMLSQTDADRLVAMDLFGSLIANTDRHFRNISLIPANAERANFRLAPIYDMLPMYYKPGSGESLSWDIFQPTAVTAWDAAHEYALHFWRLASRDRRISGAFRKVCSANHALLQQLESGPRIITQTKRVVSARLKQV